MLFGANEVAAGITGTNYIQEWTGMSDELYNGLYMGLNIASALGTIGGNVYRQTRISYGFSQADDTARAYSRYYQMEGGRVKSITHYGKGGNPNYRIDVLGTPQYIKSIGGHALPHNHLFGIYNGHVYKKSIQDINYWLWLMRGNWR